MSFVMLAFAYLKRRWGQAVLSAVVGALGIAAVATILAGFDALPRAARQAWGGVDLVVGPKGSALDLVLCCALHVAEPRGLVPAAAANKAVANPMLRAAAPIALGDSVQGWRIVGTTPAFLEVYSARFATGRVWSEEFEAVLGAAAAEALGLRVGGTFVGVHGLAGGGEAHQEFSYTVVGILARTGSVLDRLVITDIETVRHIHGKHDKEEPKEAAGGEKSGHSHSPGQGQGQGHGHDDEDAADAVTAMVAAYRVPTAALLVQRSIDESEELTAANPSFEIARLAGYARPFTTLVIAFGLLLGAIAAAGASMGLIAAMNARARDLALLRVLGASRLSLGAVALCEAAMIAAAALAFGGLLALGLLWAGRDALAERTGLVLQPDLDLATILAIISGTALIAMLAAAVPALRAMRAQPEELLQA